MLNVHCLVFAELHNCAFTVLLFDLIDRSFQSFYFCFVPWILVTDLIFKSACNFFYNLARFRKAIGIKFNIEMLYLVDEMYRQKGNTFTITFGKPIPYSTFTADKNNMAWAAWLRDQTYALKSAE